VPVFRLVLSLCCVHGRKRPVWSCGVVEWFGRPPNEQPVAWSDSWSHRVLPQMVRNLSPGGGVPLVGPQAELRYPSGYTPRGFTSSPRREAQ